MLASLQQAGRVGSSLHDALKDDDFVVVSAGRQRAQRFDIRGHVLQVMSPPHWTGQVGPTLQDTAGDMKSCDPQSGVRENTGLNEQRAGECLTSLKVPLALKSL